MASAMVMAEQYWWAVLITLSNIILSQYQIINTVILIVFLVMTLIDAELAIHPGIDNSSRRILMADITTMKLQLLYRW
jgi:hypothetical protein